MLRATTITMLVLSPALFAGITLQGGGGLNLSTSNSKTSFPRETSYLKGFNLGAGADFQVSDLFWVSPGVSMESRGEKAEVHYSFGDQEMTVAGTAHFLYLQIPLLAKVEFPAGPLAIQIIAGPELGIPLTKEIEYKTTSEGATRKSHADAILSPVDLGLTLGTALKYSMGSMGLFFEPSFYLGLTNSNDSKDDPATTDRDESGNEIMYRNVKLKVGLYKEI